LGRKFYYCVAALDVHDTAGSKNAQRNAKMWSSGEVHEVILLLALHL